MRAVLINHCHPERPHVCAVRLRDFARSLAERGHQVVLLTETLRRSDQGPDPARLGALLAQHDWRSPFNLACAPVPLTTLQRIREGALPRALRLPLIAWHYLRHGNVFEDWRRAATLYLQPLAEGFQPDVIWATFGNTGAWAIAQDLAALAGCPWVRDVKDRWANFVPAPFRALTKRRFADAAATTALAGILLEGWETEATHPTEVVRSGIPNAWAAEFTPPAPRLANGLTVAMTGGLYHDEAIGQIISGFEQWLGDHPEARICLRYAGSEGKRLAAAAHGRSPRLELDLRDFIGPDELLSLIRSADVNLYVRAGPGMFHHKLLELLAARRPILCIPAEIDESVDLAKSCGGVLVSCNTAADIGRALDRIRSGSMDAPSATDVQHLTSGAQTDRLLALFARLGIATSPEPPGKTLVSGQA